MSAVIHKHVKAKPNNKIIIRLFKIIICFKENFFITIKINKLINKN